MKCCPGCKKVKSTDNFSKCCSNKDGLSIRCRLCQKIYKKEYRQRPEVKERKRIYERKYIHRPYVKKQRQEYALKYYYNITSKDRENIWEKQNKQCAICHKKLDNFSDSRVDHDHKDNRVRGLLCNDCNLLLGHAFDNKEILRSAINYLETPDTQNISI